MAHQARKRFGQHFLHDSHVIDKIVESISPQEDIPIIEIGPGQGAITGPLLNEVDSLTVIEIDTDLASLLEDRFGQQEKLSIVTGDILQFDFTSLQYDKIKLVGNLPYNISTPILFHVIKQIAVIHSMFFMMQKEIVNRICASPGTKTYGRLSVMVQACCQADKLFDIGPGAFTPPPKVDSSILRLLPLESQDTITNQDHFSLIVKQAFNQRRKVISNSLKDFITAEHLTKLDLDPSARAENLSVQDYIKISNHS